MDGRTADRIVRSTRLISVVNVEALGNSRPRSGLTCSLGLDRMQPK
jgi:hypothetical protein